MGIQRVGVVGAGTMGAGIVQVCARAGYDVQRRDLISILQSLKTAGALRGRGDGGLLRSVVPSRAASCAATAGKREAATVATPRRAASSSRSRSGVTSG